MKDLLEKTPSKPCTNRTKTVALQMKYTKDLLVLLPLNFAHDGVTLASPGTMCTAPPLARLNELAWGIAV